MVKRKRITGAAPSTRQPPVAGADAAEPGSTVPREVVANDATVAILAGMMFLAPALGVPHEELLQDTLKSMVVSLAALGAALLFFWGQRRRSEPLRWHAVIWLPLALAAYALGSMAWSHTYLAGVEAIRWFVFSLVLWLGLNTLNRERFPLLAQGIHWGAAVASLWTVLQFWFSFKLFPQGPNPGSTFVNRNFFAEFVVCALPFSAYLLLRARNAWQVVLMSSSLSLNVLALLMTGARSALVALFVVCAIVPFVVWRGRSRLSLARCSIRRGGLAMGIVVLVLFGLGKIPTGNPLLLYENATLGHGTTPQERVLVRTASIAQAKEYKEGTFSIRMAMWQATGHMMAAHPLAGVGAGAWEVEIPLHLPANAPIETDYYAHNEILQLLAEYGVVGWAFLAALLAYLLRAVWRTLRADSEEARREAPSRTIALASILALLIVSNSGFPWRLATTGVLFALLLAVLVASDARLGYASRLQASTLPWGPTLAKTLCLATCGCLALAVYICSQAIECERNIVRAAQIALRISRDPAPNDPRWDAAKAEMLSLAERGIKINPHYRKLTPVVADNLARWGDWKNAVWVWESVAQSRPYVIAILTNISRGHLQGNNFDAARNYLERARRVQPEAPAVRSLEVIYLAHTGRVDEAVQRMKAYFKQGIYDFDLANSAYQYGSYVKDWPLALDGLRFLIEGWPENAASGWLKIGNIQANELHDEIRALAAYREALRLARPAQREVVRQAVPESYRAKL